MAQIYFNDWSTLSGGDPAPGWGRNVTAAVGKGGAKCGLVVTSIGQFIPSAFGDSDTPLANSGNVSFEVLAQFTGDTFARILARVHDCGSSNLAFSPGLGIEMGRGWGNPGFLSINRKKADGSGGYTKLIETLAPTFAEGAWYRFNVSLIDSSISVTVIRDSDGFYLNNSYAFQSGAAVAMTFTVSDMPLSGLFGIEANFGTTVFDSIEVNTLANHTKTFPPLSTFDSSRRMATYGGTYVSARGGHVIFDALSGFYFFYGTDMNGPTIYPPGSPFPNVQSLGVHLFKSRNLVDWTDEGLVYDNSDETWAVMERPKVLYSASTKTWVLYVHVETDFDYDLRRCAAFTASRPEGPFTYHSLIDTGLSTASDFTAFLDDDGTGYLIFNTGGDVKGSALTADMLTLTGSTVSLFSCEAPAIIKQGAKYFCVGSAETGWDPNANTYFTADSVLGTWTSGGNPFQSDSVEGNAVAYRSQPNCFLRDAEGRAILFCERWNKSNFGDGSYVLPAVTFPTSSTLQLDWSAGFTRATEHAPRAQGILVAY